MVISKTWSRFLVKNSFDQNHSHIGPADLMTYTRPNFIAIFEKIKKIIYFGKMFNYVFSSFPIFNYVFNFSFSSIFPFVQIYF